MIHLITRFGRDIKITRNDKEVRFVDGYAQEEGGEKTLLIRASVQPASAEELEMLPEGSDTKEALKLFTIEKLRVRSGNPPKKGDFFEVDGKVFEAISVEDHTAHNAMNIFYYKTIGVRVNYDS